MKRLLLVVPNVVSYTSFLDELSRAAAAGGYEVACACATDAIWESDVRPETAATLLPLPGARGMHPGSHLHAARALRRLIREHRPDLVHAHFSAAVLTTALARARDWPPTLATFHGLSFPVADGFRRRVLRAAEGWAASRMTEAWVLTADDQAALRAAAPAAAVRLQQSSGVGCDLDRFDPATISAADRAATRAALRLSGDDFVCAFVGRQVAFKGFDVTVRGFLRAAALRPELRLLLIGARDRLHPSGLTPDEEQALAAAPSVRHVGWSPQVERLLAICDTVVLPSEREGMPVSAMEALAMGVPVVTRDARGGRDVVRDGVDGYVLPRPGADDVAAAMLRLAADGEERSRLQANAIAGRGRFSRDVFVAEQLATYARVTGAAAVAAASPRRRRPRARR